MTDAKMHARLMTFVKAQNPSNFCSKLNDFHSFGSCFAAETHWHVWNSCYINKRARRSLHLHWDLFSFVTISVLRLNSTAKRSTLLHHDPLKLWTSDWHARHLKTQTNIWSHFPMGSIGTQYCFQLADQFTWSRTLAKHEIFSKSSLILWQKCFGNRWFSVRKQTHEVRNISAVMALLFTENRWFSVGKQSKFIK